MSNISKISIGKDINGKDLFINDKCKFIVKLSRPTGEINSYGQKIYRDQIIEGEGTIFYDEYSYAYAFDTNLEYAPCLLLHVVDYGSIEKIEEA